MGKSTFGHTKPVGCSCLVCPPCMGYLLGREEHKRKGGYAFLVDWGSKCYEGLNVLVKLSKQVRLMERLRVTLSLVLQINSNL